MTRVKLPDGNTAVFPDTMSQDEIAAVLRKQFPPKAKAPVVAPTPVDPAEGMAWHEKALAGVGGGMRNAYLGAKNLIGQGTPEEAEERKYWQANKDPLGGWGTAGEIGGEIIATAPLGGVVGTGAKVLTKAVPALKALGAIGGRVGNVGNVGKAAAEGALSAGVVGDASDQGIGDRLDNVIMGGTVGAALPLAMAGGAGVKKLAGTMRGTPEKAAVRAGEALERTLGPDTYKDLVTKVRTASPTRLPQTTAALADDMRLGALERGARARELVDFTPHDTKVYSRVWDTLQDDTYGANLVPKLEKRPDKIMDTAKAMFRDIPFEEADKMSVYAKLEPILNSDELRANPQLSRKITQAAQAVLNPEATTEILPQLYWSLKELGEGSTAASQLRKVIGEEADQLTGGLFSRMHGAYGRKMTDLGQAKAAENVRRTFISPEGIPLTPQSFGGAATGGEVVPRVRPSVLNKALAKEADKLEPGSLGDLRNTAEELRRHEIYRPVADTGGTQVDLNSLRSSAVALANVTPMWRAKGPLSVIYGKADKATQRAVDEALLDPKKFLSIAAAKQQANKPLTMWEKSLVNMINAQARSAAVSSGE